MANTRNVAKGDIGWLNQVLTAGVADNVIFPQEIEAAEVLSDGSAVVYVCTTGDDAVVPGAGVSSKVRPIPAGAARSIVVPVNGTRVSVISSATPTVSVTRSEVLPTARA